MLNCAQADRFWAQRARQIAGELAATRGWNTRIITETGRALAVILLGSNTRSWQ